jgi:hypothetical protein
MGKLKDYVDARDRIDRCNEEAVFLREDARDAMVYHRKQEAILQASYLRETDQDAIARSHKLLLELELVKVRRLIARLLKTQAYLVTLFGELDSEPDMRADETMEPDVAAELAEEEDLGGDSEVFPEAPDEVGYGSGEEDDDEEGEGEDEEDSGYTSVRADDSLSDDGARMS